LIVSTQTNEDYRKVDKIDAFKGVVENKYSNRGGIYLLLNNGNKILLLTVNNYNYSPSAIDDFIMIGDSIVKQSNSGIIHVFRNKKYYRFIMDKDIKKEKKKLD